MFSSQQTLSTFFQPIDRQETIASLFAHAADGKLEQVENIIKNNPSLVHAIVNVKSSSGDTYMGVTFAQFIYLMDDIPMYRMLVREIAGLSLSDREKVDAQFESKMKEVKEQLKEFKGYDFTHIVTEISSDENLKNDGIASKKTIDILAGLKIDFSPCEIVKGKSLILQHLQSAYTVGDECKKLWSKKQYNWYKIHVVGFLQSRVVTCNEFAFSQGLQVYTAHKTPPTRTNTVKNHIHLSAKDHSSTLLPLDYKGTENCKLGEHYFIDICYGTATTFETVQGECFRNPRLTEYIKQLDNDFQQCLKIHQKQGVFRRLS